MSGFGPGAMPPPTYTLTFAGFRVRVVAYLIDGVLINVVLWVLALASGTSMMDFDPTSPAGMRAFWSAAFAPFLVSAVYTIGFWISSGATPGKMLFGMRIVRNEDGGPISAGQAIGRFLGYFVSSLVFALGFIWVVFDARKQGWHDKLASTVVVR